jgi:multisubunit Na+/H+ antiporter MnhB subunit
MLSSMFIQRTTAILAAVMGGFGVFFAVYSSASPEVAAKAIVLLGCAGALSYFGERP